MPTMTIEPISQIEVVRFTAAFGPGYSTCGHEHVLIEEAQACADDMRSITIPYRDGYRPRFWTMTIQEWEGEYDAYPWVQSDRNGPYLDWPLYRPEED